MEQRSIIVDHGSCIRCGHCVVICPSMIFVQQTPKSEIGVQKEKNCIVCGHCVAACPTSSIVHSDFPPGTVHAVDRSRLPSPDQVMLLCKTRRSNRAFSRKPVPLEIQQQILEAAHRAPTASNMQQVEFTVITDPDMLVRVCEYTVDYMRRMTKLLGNPLLKPMIARFMPSASRYLPIFRRIIREFESGNKMLILRNASGLIFIHTPADSRFGRDDANLAYQNGSLMAESLGVTQIYSGFVMSAIRGDKKNRLAKMLGIEGRAIHAGMMIGYKAFELPNYIDKKEIRVNRLDAKV